VLVAGLVALIVLVAVIVVLLVTPDLLLLIFEQARTAFFVAVGAIGALFHWIGSFFPSVESPTGPLPTGPAGGPFAPATPAVSSTTVAEPPFWLFELLLTFVGVVFLFFASRALLRLMRMRVTGFELRMPRVREPAPPVSTADALTWRGWWRQLLTWLRVWLAGGASPAGQAARSQQGAGAVVAEQRSIRALYRELLGMVARAGFERQPSTTPNELAREVSSARPAAARAMSTMTELYVRARYGEEPVGRDELSRMRSALQQARRDLIPPPTENPRGTKPNKEE
jgi:hypothetical protein